MSINHFMEISRTVLIGIYVAVALYILFRFFFKKNLYQEEYERLYNKILTSKEHRVKGQYDKDE